MSWHGKYHKGAMREYRRVKSNEAYIRQTKFTEYMDSEDDKLARLLSKAETPEERLLLAIFGEGPIRVSVDDHTDIASNWI